MNLIFEGETYAIIGAAMAVHQELGHGFLEAVYQEALEKEFHLRAIPFAREKPITIYYKNSPLKKGYIADFLCYEKIIIELKALTAIAGEHKSQIINYRAASGLSLGIIINFGKPRLEHIRVVNTKITH
jgi:GxxExxY protein